MTEFQFVQIPVQAQVAQQPQSRRLLPPVRIRVALEYLRFAALKPAKGAVVGPMSIEIVPGQQLSRAEANARESAANLLNDYFNGKM